MNTIRLAIKKIKSLVEKRIIWLDMIGILIFLLFMPLNVEAATTDNQLDYDKSEITFTLNNGSNGSNGSNGKNSSNNVLSFFPQTGEASEHFIATIGTIIILVIGWIFVRKEMRKGGGRHAAD